MKILTDDFSVHSIQSYNSRVTTSASKCDVNKDYVVRNIDFSDYDCALNENDENQDDEETVLSDNKKIEKNDEIDEIDEFDLTNTVIVLENYSF